MLTLTRGLKKGIFYPRKSEKNDKTELAFEPDYQIKLGMNLLPTFDVYPRCLPEQIDKFCLRIKIGAI